MKTAIMTGIRQLAFEERPVPQPGPKDVLVRVNHVGICGSDLHYFEHGRIGAYIVEPPFVLGHEAAGTVVALGDQVTSLAVGDRVAMEPGITCGECEFCRSGRYNLCPDVVFFATPPIDGTFQEFVTHPADLCFKLPDGMSTLDGALIEPLAVGFHAARQGNAQLGHTAVVFGSGAIGLVSMMALKAMGLHTVIVVDVMPNRLAKATELGATETVNARETDVIEEVDRLTHGRGVDLVIETSGTEVATRQAIHVTRKGATIVLVGYGASGEMTLPMSLALDKELRFETVFRYRHIYPLAIEAVATGRVNLKYLPTHVFAFDDLQAAMDAAIDDKATVVKAVIEMPAGE